MLERSGKQSKNKLRGEDSKADRKIESVNSSCGSKSDPLNRYFFISAITIYRRAAVRYLNRALSGKGSTFSVRGSALQM